LDLNLVPTLCYVNYLIYIGT